LSGGSHDGCVMVMHALHAHAAHGCLRFVESVKAGVRRHLLHDSRREARHSRRMNTDDLLANLACGLIRDLRRWREVGPAIRRVWVRLYVGVIRRARRARPFIERLAAQLRTAKQPSRP